jgi:transposase
MGYSACGRPLPFRREVQRFRLMRPRSRCGIANISGRRGMNHYAGLDVSLKETSICILDEAGKICREIRVASHPEDLLRILQDPAWHLERIGLEAGLLSRWLFNGLAEAGLPVVCIETRHAKAFLKARVNKSDRSDARGIAQMMRVNLFRPVHVKTLTSQKRRVLLTARKLLQEKAIAFENEIRGLLANFGLKVGVVGAVKFEERIRELIADMPDLAEIMAPLLDARRRLREHFATLHRKLLELARGDDVCRRLMSIPGVGPVVSLAFVATIDTPARFRTSKAVGPALGLTPVRNQSGDNERIGRISLCGDAMMRTLLFEAAQTMLRQTTRWSWLKAWAMKVAQRRGSGKAVVALARRLAVIMHRMWRDGTQFRWTREVPAA